MELVLNAQYSSALINLLRQAAVTCTSRVRPIAFSVGHASNVLMISDSVEEDMTTFIRNVCNGQYRTTQNKEIIVCECVCAGVLSTNAFEQDGIEPIQDFQILHSLGEIDVRVIFRQTSGSYTREDNEQCLADAGIDLSRYTVIPSRHSDVANFSYTLKKGLTEDVYDVNILSFSGKSEEEIISLAKEEIIQALQTM